jgi:hypothetical protein
MSRSRSERLSIVSSLAVRRAGVPIFGASFEGEIEPVPALVPSHYPIS